METAVPQLYEGRYAALVAVQQHCSLVATEVVGGRCVADKERESSAGEDGVGPGLSATLCWGDLTHAKRTNIVQIHTCMS